jgi:putative ABC transport system ATP-binding protein
MSDAPSRSSDDHDPSYIQVHELSKIYSRTDGAVHALQGVTLTVARGEIVGLMGPSGSGKSTLLNLIGGLDRPTEGRVVVEATDISKLSADSLALYRREKVGFVFQDARLIPALTVYENVMLPLVPMQMPDDEKRSRVEMSLEECNITHRAQHLPGELSGGEQQRTAVARAMVNDPHIILADEPTGELDPENAARIVDLLRQINRDGRTVLVASHDANAMAQMPRLIKIREGQLEDGQA